MNAGSIELRGWFWLGCALTLFGCERLTADPPPAPSRHEIPAAPPAAVGAHAASNPGDAPVLDRSPSQPTPDSDSEGESESGPDVGPDAGAPPPPEGIAL